MGKLISSESILRAIHQRLSQNVERKDFTINKRNSSFLSSEPALHKQRFLSLLCQMFPSSATPKGLGADVKVRLHSF